MSYPFKAASSAAARGRTPVVLHPCYTSMAETVTQPREVKVLTVEALRRVRREITVPVAGWVPGSAATSRCRRHNPVVSGRPGGGVRACWGASTVLIGSPFLVTSRRRSGGRVQPARSRAPEFRKLDPAPCRPPNVGARSGPVCRSPRWRIVLIPIGGEQQVPNADLSDVGRNGHRPAEVKWGVHPQALLVA